MKNIFVGNLSFEASELDVQKLFEPFGTVADVVIMRRDKDKSRGYGFVDMPDAQLAQAAIAALEGREFMGRPLSVSPVQPKIKKEPKKRWANIVAKSGIVPKAHLPRRESKPYRRDDRGAKRPIEDRPSKLEHRNTRPKASFSLDRESKFRGARKDQARHNPRIKDRSNTPWNKTTNSPKPYRKFENSSKSESWTERDARAYSADHRGPRVSRDGVSRPYQKSEGLPKPWEKNKNGLKPYRKFDSSPKSQGNSERSFKPNSRMDRDQAREREDEGETKPVRRENFSSRPWLKMKSASKPFAKSAKSSVKLRRINSPKSRSKD